MGIPLILRSRRTLIERAEAAEKLAGLYYDMLSHETAARQKYQRQADDRAFEIFKLKGGLRASERVE